LKTEAIVERDVTTPQLPLNSGNRSVRPDRQGKRTIAFHVDHEVYRRFVLVKAKFLATTQDLGIIAVDLLIKNLAPELDQVPEDDIET
jgi:hypothetical protein